MMDNRLYRTLALIAAGWFSLLVVMHSPAGAASAEMGQPSAVVHFAQLPKDRRETPPKTHLKKKTVTRITQKERQPDSDFVVLSRLIIGNALPAAPPANAATSGFTPENVAFILGAETTRWAVGFDSAYPAEIAGQNLAILKTDRTLGKLAPQSLRSSLARRSRGNSFETKSPNPLLSTSDSDGMLKEISGFKSDDLLEMHAGCKGSQGLEAGAISRRSGSPFVYRYQKDNVSVNAGFSWLNDVSDPYVGPQTFEEAGLSATVNRVSGLNVNLGASYRALSLTGGYIRALDRFAPAHLSLDEGASEPTAWNSELAYTTELLRKETVLAVGYQRSSEALQLYLPEQRYSTKASMSIFDGAKLSLEYYLDKEAVGQGDGADAQGYGFTTRIGFGL